MSIHHTALTAGHYIDWGVISISVTNLSIILAMVVVFVLAIVLPFPHTRPDDEVDRRDPS
ncbi:hypothetical protein ACT8ZV_21720 [Nocardioides sp. MAHUQ-72]|uniref:hypothetical protein n=1 Tax=unclassified Nocardioides TaxID=2615069 RepID=UPI00361849AF